MTRIKSGFLSVLSAFPDFSWQRFVFDFAAAADGNFRRFAVTDPAFFAVEISRRQRSQRSGERRVETRLIDTRIIDRSERANHRFSYCR